MVEPTIGADTPSFDSIHATATCAMLLPLRLAISSTLHVQDEVSDCSAYHDTLSDTPRYDIGGRFTLIPSEHPEQKLNVARRKRSEMAYLSAPARFDSVLGERVRSPRARGDHGVAPTPNICGPEKRSPISSPDPQNVLDTP